MFDTLSKAGKYLGQAAKMMIGVPDYDNYVEHMRITHPDQTPMTYEGRALRRQGRGEVLLTLFRQIEADLLLGTAVNRRQLLAGALLRTGVQRFQLRHGGLADAEFSRDLLLG